MNISVIDGAKSGVKSGDSATDHIPHNIALEKALLGAILYDNEHFNSVLKIVESDHFYSAINRKLYAIIEKIIYQGRIASMDTIRPYIANDESIKEFGIAKYLGDIASYYINAKRAKEYALYIREFAILRKLMEVGDTLGSKARLVDPDRSSKEIIEETESALYQLRETGDIASGSRQISNIAISAVKQAIEARDRDTDFAGLPTGLIDLDKKIGGLQRSDLIIIAARPSMGKTALATNIAHNIAKRFEIVQQAEGVMLKRGGKVAIFSLEMSAVQLAARILAADSGVPASNIRNKKLPESDFKKYADAALELAMLPLYIDDTGGLTIAELSIRANRLHRQVGGLDLIVVDYIQLMQGSRKASSRNYEIAEITGGLKTLAKELDIPIIAISQLNRSADNREDKRPQLADLRDSGAIEQDADLVIFVDRKSYYLSRSEPDLLEEKEHEQWKQKCNKHHGKANIIIDKNRNGPTGTVRAKFNEELTYFSNLAEYEADEDYVPDATHSTPPF